jgi:hypothetical protein
VKFEVRRHISANAVKRRHGSAWTAARWVVRERTCFPYNSVVIWNIGRRVAAMDIKTKKFEENEECAQGNGGCQQRRIDDCIMQLVGDANWLGVQHETNHAPA